jgi:hypothetical protein
MIFLAGVFGFLAVMSGAALVMYRGNPVFVFTLLLSLASAAWMVRLEKLSGGARSPSRRKASR